MTFSLPGLIPSLTGLNIANNPLEFPPPSVVEGGARCVLDFLKDLIRAKSDAQMGLLFRTFSTISTFGARKTAAKRTSVKMENLAMKRFLLAS